MAGAMRKMAVYLGLVEDENYDDDYMYGNGEQSREREDQRVGARSGDRYAERETSRPAEPRGSEQLRVTERDEDEFSRRRLNAERPARDWRTDTVVQQPIGAHPAGSRVKPPAAARPVKQAADPMKITTLHPRSFNDARRIGEEFRSGTPVIMNLTELDDTDAKRIVDFAAGLIFGLRGSIERVTNKVFMLSPANVEVSAESARAQLEQEGQLNRR